MAEKLIVGPIDKGLRNNRLPFNIDNDSFPYLINAYQWRGRIKRKRGTEYLGQLQRNISASGALGGGTITLTSPVVPGTIDIIGGSDGTIYTDPLKNGVLKATGGTGTGGNINYSTGLLTITGGGTETITGTYSYFPELPVMGLEDFVLTNSQFPGTIAFDTKYSYSISTANPYPIDDVTFYKNPPINTLWPLYVPKTSLTPFTWNGQNYQQFWTTNYQGALWATNGVTVPLPLQNIGMQFAPALNITYVSNTTTTIILTITGSSLVIGDFVFLNEFTGTNALNLNFQSGYVTNVSGDNYTIKLPNANLGTGPYTPGIVQYLTNSSNTTIDCIRWYDGDPAGNSGLGWVNFMPPLNQAPYLIDDLPPRQYYLVGAKMIVPFKGRLLFLGPVVQASTGSPIYLQDTIVYSQDGTPYYTSSFTGSPVNPANLISILTPTNQSAIPSGWFEDDTGFGGFAGSNLDQPFTTVAPNRDVLIIGTDPTYQVALVFTGDDISPFQFYIRNSELGSSSTFSAITLDQGVMTRGVRGFVISSQDGAERFDLDIPDESFKMNLQNNGNERFTSQRDFINEWVYFTYCNNEDGSNINVFPNQTLQYNYRDNTWGVFEENYTTYGQFRPVTGFTWDTLPTDLTWDTWTDPWNAGVNTPLQPLVIGGNQQGFILIRGSGTAEATSLLINSFSGSVVTSNNHCLNNGDYIMISGALGTIGTQVNNNVYSVFNVTQNTFNLNPNIPVGSYTYLGNGYITRYYVPFIQTKQFPTAWGMARKTRIGFQQYLLTKTQMAQITLLIYLSQDESDPYNDPTYAVNNGLIYSTVLYTCPESTNLGLTPANTNLQELNAISGDGTSTNNQQQIWHRVNTSLIGDTVQLGFTMSDAQMRDPTLTNQVAEIELHGFILDVSASSMLS